MSYIGNPIVSTDFPKDTFSGNGSTTAFTMQIAPASVNSVIVVVSGITQDPSTYTISGTTLTFSAAPPTGTSNISVRHLGVAGIPNTPSAGSVVATSIADGVITAAKFASGQTPAFNGIAFPAAQSASADANTLDDYEEGTWTPVLAQNGGGGTFNYTGRSGFYVKIGNTVFASFDLNISSVSGMNGDFIYITLPFNIGSIVRQPITMSTATGLSTAYNVQAQNNGSSFYLSYSSTLNSGINDVVSTNLTTNTRITGTITYKV